MAENKIYIYSLEGLIKPELMRSFDSCIDLASKEINTSHIVARIHVIASYYIDSIYGTINSYNIGYLRPKTEIDDCASLKEDYDNNKECLIEREFTSKIASQFQISSSHEQIKSCYNAAVKISPEDLDYIVKIVKSNVKIMIVGVTNNMHMNYIKEQLDTEFLNKKLPKFNDNNNIMPTLSYEAHSSNKLELVKKGITLYKLNIDNLYSLISETKRDWLTYITGNHEEIKSITIEDFNLLLSGNTENHNQQ